jgi:hypothetical protein
MVDDWLDSTLVDSASVDSASVDSVSVQVVADGRNLQVFTRNLQRNLH